MTQSTTASTTGALLELASNLHWTWHSPTRDLLDRLPRHEPGVHPLATLSALDDGTIEDWLVEHEGRIGELHRELCRTVDSVGNPEIAYFSPEFGIAAEVPQYSGGLGILAGDHLKAASDLALPLIGIGLFYHEGFFRQGIDDTEQTERYEAVDAKLIGAVDTGVIVSVAIDGEPVDVRVWKQMVGATALYLLDTDLATNSEYARQITDRLYSGGRRHRLDQELILGVGGVRALRALDIEPSVFHLNEGHACFLLLELLGELIDDGSTLDQARAAVRSSTLFTTHTPVPAGIDRFDRALVTKELMPWADRLGITIGELLDWAVLPSDGPKKPFNTAALAFELCDRANGVSQLHAGVSRKLFSTLPRAQGVEGITNGVHARTWVDPRLQVLYDRCLGDGWADGAPDAWTRVDQIDPDEFRSIRRTGRSELVDVVAATTGTDLDPDRCIVGFARRFATYKRAALLLRDPDGLEAAFDAGLQFVFAGKAHPADSEGKAVLHQIAKFAESRRSHGALVVVPDYDIGIARHMYAGCDVWLNNPVRPREASGTSGEKAALNGGLNCSILDGWWADWHVDGIGWAIPTSSAGDEDARDRAEARSMNSILAHEVAPAFDDPDSWWRIVSKMLGHLGPRVTAARMVAEYQERFYDPIRAR